MNESAMIILMASNYCTYSSIYSINCSLPASVEGFRNEDFIICARLRVLYYNEIRNVNLLIIHHTSNITPHEHFE